jgi:hypothetical protein
MLNKISIITLVWVSISAALPAEKPSFEEYNNMEDSIKADNKPNPKLAAKEKVGFWIEPEMGGSNLGISPGLGLVIHKKLDVIISVAAHSEFSLFSGAISDELIEYNLMLGKNKKSGLGYFFARAGLGYVNGRVKKHFVNRTSCGGLFNDIDCIYDVEKVNSLGIPIEAGVIWGKYLGIGVKLHANISQQPVFGFKVVTALGKFNDR